MLCRDRDSALSCSSCDRDMREAVAVSLERGCVSWHPG